jgi:putative transposase
MPVMAREHLPVQLACRVLHVAESGYYAWRDRPPSNRLVKHAWLTEASWASTSPPAHVRHPPRARRARSGPAHPHSHGAVELLMQRAGLHGLLGNRRHGTP